EFMKWLTKHLRYPNKARQENVQGRVLAVFYVEKDGHISGVCGAGILHNKRPKSHRASSGPWYAVSAGSGLRPHRGLPTGALLHKKYRIGIRGRHLRQLRSAGNRYSHHPG
ncbi:MAG: energy transducer TonB, partial [Firmicutes bacterium]|nr:energy transducer TonB [Bacillota bacterium]